MGTSPRSWAAALSLSVLALGVTGCGADDAAPVTSSSTSTSADSTASDGSTGDGDGSSETRALLERLRAGLGEEGSAHLTLRARGAIRITAQGDASYGPDGPELQVTARVDQLGEGRITILLVDGTAYVSLPGVTPAGKFFEIPVDKARPSTVDPAELVKGLEAGALDVQHLGEEEIAGLPVEHYRLSVDGAAIMRHLKPHAMPMKGAGALPRTLPFDLWLDEQDRLRRARVAVSGLTLVADLTDWGKPVDVQAPDQSDLVGPPAGLR